MIIVVPETGENFIVSRTSFLQSAMKHKSLALFQFAKSIFQRKMRIQAYILFILTAVLYTGA